MVRSWLRRAHGLNSAKASTKASISSLVFTSVTQSSIPLGKRSPISRPPMIPCSSKWVLMSRGRAGQVMGNSKAKDPCRGSE